MVAGLRATAAGRFQVSAAYRYGQPSIDQEIARVGREGSGPLVVVPLFPQRTDPTTGTAFRRAAQAAGRNGISSRLVPRLIEPDDRGYVEAMVARWNQALAQTTEKPEHLVVSFHGIPVRYDRREGRTYTRDCEATTRALVSALGWPAERTTLAYQSKFGPEPWLLPATAEVLERLPRQGIRRLAVITPGFLTEGLETIEEIGIRGAEAFAAAGGSTLIRIGAVEDHPAMLRSLAALAIASS
jgi:ferrochelatase